MTEFSDTVDIKDLRSKARIRLDAAAKFMIIYDDEGREKKINAANAAETH
jgi:hypothetical protein